MCKKEPMFPGWLQNQEGSVSGTLRVGMLPGENCMKSFNKENLASSNMNSLNELIQD